MEHNILVQAQIPFEEHRSSIRKILQDGKAGSYFIERPTWHDHDDLRLKKRTFSRRKNLLYKNAHRGD